MRTGFKFIQKQGVITWTLAFLGNTILEAFTPPR